MVYAYTPAHKHPCMYAPTQWYTHNPMYCKSLTCKFFWSGCVSDIMRQIASWCVCRNQQFTKLCHRECVSLSDVTRPLFWLHQIKTVIPLEFASSRRLLMENTFKVLACTGSISHKNVKYIVLDQTEDPPNPVSCFFSPIKYFLGSRKVKATDISRSSSNPLTNNGQKHTAPELEAPQNQHN